MIETGSSQEKDMLTSSVIINDNYESLIAKNRKDKHGDEILDDNDSTLKAGTHLGSKRSKRSKNGSNGSKGSKRSR